MDPIAPRSTSVISGLCGLHRLQRCIGGLGDLPAFTLRHDVHTGRIDRWELLRDERRLRPYDFEFEFGVAGRREIHEAQNIAALRATRKPQVVSLLGLSDIYVPLLVAPSFTLIFFCGPWTSELPTRQSMTSIWRQLSGREAALSDALFRRWVRCCLRMPVLSAEVQRGLIELGMLLPKLFSGESRAAEREIERVRAQIFVPEIHDDGWVDSCLDVTGLTRPPWGLHEFLEQRILEETSLRHRPSQLAILVPGPAEQPSDDPLELWIQERRFQHQAIHLAREIPDSIAAALGDHAVLVAFAAEPSIRGRARSILVESKCRKLQQLLKERAGLGSVAGLGTEVAPGQGLGQCFRRAAAALEKALHDKKPLIRATLKEVANETDVNAELQMLGQRLKRAFELGRVDEARVEVLHYSRDLLAATGAQPQAMIVHFLLLLRELLSALEAQGVIQSARRRKFESDALQALAAITAPERLVNEFERIGNTLATLAARDRTADRVERLRSSIEWLRNNLRVENAVKVCARRAGLATSSFRRAFREQHGVSFALWLRHERLDAAKRTLLLSDLGIAEVARDAGFGDVHTFIRCFRSKFGQTPGAFRRRVEGKA